MGLFNGKRKVKAITEEEEMRMLSNICGREIFFYGQTISNLTNSRLIRDTINALNFLSKEAREIPTEYSLFDNISLLQDRLKKHKTDLYELDHAINDFLLRDGSKSFNDRDEECQKGKGG